MKKIIISLWIITLLSTITLCLGININFSWTGQRNIRLVLPSTLSFELEKHSIADIRQYVTKYLDDEFSAIRYELQRIMINGQNKTQQDNYTVKDTDTVTFIVQCIDPENEDLFNS